MPQQKVRMRSPDGEEAEVDAADVDLFLKHGATVVETPKGPRGTPRATLGAAAPTWLADPDVSKRVAPMIAGMMTAGAAGGLSVPLQMLASGGAAGATSLATGATPRQAAGEAVLSGGPSVLRGFAPRAMNRAADMWMRVAGRDAAEPLALGREVLQHGYGPMTRANARAAINDPALSFGTGEAIREAVNLRQGPVKTNINLLGGLNALLNSGRSAQGLYRFGQSMQALPQLIRAALLSKLAAEGQ